MSFSVDFAVSPRQSFCDNQMRQMFEDVLCKGLFRNFELIVMLFNINTMLFGNIFFYVGHRWVFLFLLVSGV